jgi:hypothetical protein
MENSETLSGQISILRANGYTEDFNLKEDSLECRDGEYKLLHDEFNVDEVFRFEGDSDPADEAILFAISSDHIPLKGILVNGYGIYTDRITDLMVQKLHMHK